MSAQPMMIAFTSGRASGREGCSLPTADCFAAMFLLRSTNVFTAFMFCSFEKIQSPSCEDSVFSAGHLCGLWAVLPKPTPLLSPERNIAAITSQVVAQSSER